MEANGSLLTLLGGLAPSEGRGQRQQGFTGGLASSPQSCVVVVLVLMKQQADLWITKAFGPRVQGGSLH